MNRRSFLGSILAAAAAPAIVRADSLMRIVPREVTVETLASCEELALPAAFEIGFYEGIRFVESGPAGLVVVPDRILKAARSLTLDLIRAEIGGA